MNSINPIGGIHPSFGSWVERTRARLSAQMVALDADQIDEVSAILERDREDRPHDDRRNPEAEAALLEEAEALTRRLARMRQEVLEELKELEREQVAGAPPDERRSRRGSSLDGYL